MPHPSRSEGWDVDPPPPENFPPTIHAFLEDKYDGIRAQLHCGDPEQPRRVAIYSRNRDDIMPKASPNSHRGLRPRRPRPRLGLLILDGEILGWHFGKSAETRMPLSRGFIAIRDTLADFLLNHRTSRTPFRCTEPAHRTQASPNRCAPPCQSFADFIAEVFGGPKEYSARLGGHAGMIRHHLGRGITEQQRHRWVTLLLETADELNLPTDPEFRSALVAYLEWGSRLAVINSSLPADTPLDQSNPMPAWNWGVPGGPFQPSEPKE